MSNLVGSISATVQVLYGVTLAITHDASLRFNSYGSFVAVCTAEAYHEMRRVLLLQVIEVGDVPHFPLV